MRASTLRLSFLWILLSGLVAAPACSDSDDVDDPFSNTGASGSTSAAGGSGGAGGSPSGGVQARFELPASGAPSFLEVPFPSNLYLDRSGTVVEVPGLDTYVNASEQFLATGMAGLDGFGTLGGAIFALDDASGEAPEIDLATLPADEAASLADDATALLVDLDAGERVAARVAYQDDRPIEGKMRPQLVVYPGRGLALKPGNRYAAVITTGIETTDGDPIAPTEAFAAIADGSQRETDAEQMYGEAIDQVAEVVPGLEKSKIAAVAVYTTSTNRSELAALRGQLASMPPPALSWSATDIAPMGVGLFANTVIDEFTATLDAWLGTPEDLPAPGVGDDPANDQTTGKAHDALAAVGTAVFEAPNFMIEATGYGDVEHHNFARDASGTPIINPDKPTSKVWVTFALPTGAMPPGGFPVVIMQHGLGGDRSYLLAMANTFAQKGWATVAIESVTFGARSADPVEDAASIFPWSATAAYNGPDGFVDDPAGATAFFGVLRNLAALRDQMRQSVLDIGTLVDVLRSNPDLGPLQLAVPNATIDGTRIAYLGNSLGGIMGALHASTDPYVKTYVLNVAGGGLLTELSNGPIIAGQIEQATSLNFGTGTARLAPGHPVLQLMQHVVDLGDPLAYAHQMVLAPAMVGGNANPKKNVLQIEALWDEWVSNESNEALAFAAGLPLAEPSVGARTGLPFTAAGPGPISGVPEAGLTAVLVQTSPATHGANLHDRQGHHGYAYPWPRWTEEEPFVNLPAEITLAQPYLPLQTIAVEFIATAFAGAGAPVVGLFPEPVNDFDGDGALDDDDSDPNDPAVQ